MSEITLSDISIVPPVELTIDTMILDQLRQLDTSVRFRPTTSSPHARTVPTNLADDWADTSSIHIPDNYSVTHLDTVLRNVISIGRGIHLVESGLLNDEDLLDDETGDDHGDADDEDEGDESSSDGYDLPPTARPVSSPTARRLLTTWRGDSPRPGTAAARLAAERVRITRREMEITRRRRQSSSWDNFADVATPVTPDLIEPVQPAAVGTDVDVGDISDTAEDPEDVFSPGNSFLFPEPRTSRLHGRRHWHGRTLRDRPKVDYKTLNMTGVIKYKKPPSSGDDEC